MLKLNASYSKKIPADEEYSSQSYHCAVEVEIPDGLTQRQLTGRIHDTFELVRTSVENELRNGNAAGQAPSAPAPPGAPAQKGNPGPKASGKQLKFLTDLAVRQKMGTTALNAEAQRLFSVTDTSQLTRLQASRFIDILNGGSEAERKAA
jgi:hypothetical protein